MEISNQLIEDSLSHAMCDKARLKCTDFLCSLAFGDELRISLNSLRFLRKYLALHFSISTEYIGTDIETDKDTKHNTLQEYCRLMNKFTQRLLTGKELVY
jgi:hypothetical protein